jgi:glycosyltransferase involved in cell wall biosynthesis
VADTDNRSTGARTGREIEGRLDELEREIRSVGRDQVEIQALREAVDDLAADMLDLHNQLSKIVTSCERLLAGAGGDATLDRRGRFRSSASTLRRATGRAVRGTIGAARRLLGTREPQPDRLPDLEIRTATTPTRRAPRLAAVVRVADDPEMMAVPDEILAQTETELEVVLWAEDAATAVLRRPGEEPIRFGAADRRAVAEALTAEWVIDLAAPVTGIGPTCFELCRWTVASEDVPLIVCGDRSPPASAGRCTVDPVGGWVEKPSGDDRAPARLTKIVNGRRWIAAGVEEMAVVGAAGGRGYLAAAGEAESAIHEVAPVSGVVTAAREDDGRPAMLVTSTSRGVAVAAWLLQRLSADHRVIVAMLEPSGSGAVNRALTELGATVYPLADFLEPPVYPSLLAELVRARDIRTLIRIDTPLELAGVGDGRPRVIDLPFSTDAIGGDPDLVLALGRGLAAEARSRGLETIELVPAPDLPGEMPNPGDAGGIRSAYGVDGAARLVLWIGDLTPERRPEDAAAVAYRLRDRDDLHLLVIGQGPLAGTVSDIAGYLGLDRFNLAPPGHSLPDLVSACDCVLSTAEEDLWPTAVAAGLALGRAVVATEVDGVRELVAAAEGDRCTLCAPGDVDAMSAAIGEALDHGRTPRVTKKAWVASSARAAAAAETVRDAVARAASGETKKG